MASHVLSVWFSAAFDSTLAMEIILKHLTLLSLNFRQTFFPFFVCTDRPCQGPRQVFVGDGTACPRATGRIRDGAIAPGGCDRMLPKERNQPLHRLQGSKPKIL